MVGLNALFSEVDMNRWVVNRWLGRPGLEYEYSCINMGLLVGWAVFVSRSICLIDERKRRDDDSIGLEWLSIYSLGL